MMEDMTPHEYRKKIDVLLDLSAHKKAISAYRQEAPMLSPKQLKAIYLMSGEAGKAEHWDSVAVYVGLSPFLMQAWLLDEDFTAMMNAHCPHENGNMTSMTFAKKEEQQFAVAHLIQLQFKTIEARGQEFAEEEDSVPDHVKYGLMVREYKKMGNEKLVVWKTDSSIVSEIRNNIRLQAELSGTLGDGDDADLKGVSQIIFNQIDRITK